MFGEKAFGCRARRAPQQAQWTAGDVRENPIGDVGVELGQALLGDSRFFPENSLRMRKADANWSWRNAGLRSHRRRLQNDFLGRLVIPETLEGRRPIPPASCRPISMSGFTSTMRRGHIKDAGASFLDAMPMTKEKMIAV
jgi:hypothetical protein